MESELKHNELVDLLKWQLELGVTETMNEAPVNRYQALNQEVDTQLEVSSLNSDSIDLDAYAIAVSTANSSKSLQDLFNALENFEHCDLKQGARKLVFSDGEIKSRVMVIGEAPGREEDKTGKPFVGPAGQLLDKMFQAIDFERFSENNSFYVTNVIPWRPPQNRTPTEVEINILKPFLIKHIDLIKPEIIVLMGNTPCQALLGETGITKLRGHWKKFLTYPVLPMFHPAYLLRNPAAKKETWEDLKMLKKRLGGNL
tara:strand:- start:410 stop:1180 length:771 start_codon:yes stop_codon:yes gene_type:complete